MMKFHKLLYHIGIILMVAKLPSGSEGINSPSDICPQQSIAGSVTCRTTQWLQWRIVFEDSLAVPDITMQYIPSDAVGHTQVITESGLNFTFNLTVNDQSQQLLVSIMTVTSLINNTMTNTMTVHCGQEIHQLPWITVQNHTLSDPPVPASPVISNESIVTGDSHGVAIMLEWTSSDASVVDGYIINISPPIESVSSFTTANTSIQLFIQYNQEYNVSVVATSYAGNSTPTLTDVKIGYCAPPIVNPNVTVMGNNSGFIQGTTYMITCQQPGNESTVGPMATVCTRDGNWSPNPDELVCDLNYTMTTSTSTYSSSNAEKSRISMLLASTPLVIGLLLPLVFIVVIMTLGLFVVYLKAKINGPRSPKVNSSLSEINGEEVQINDSITIQEQGIYSLLQAESETDHYQLNDVEKKQAHGQLIYADIGNSVAQYTAPVSAMSYPSLSLQLDDSQVQYADINPQQSTANHNSNTKVDTEAGAAAPSTTFLSDDFLSLDTLLIQLRSEVTLKWREFGQAVGLAEELLDKYSMYPPEECIVEVLDVWLRNYNCSDRDTDNNNMRRKPTWRDVAKALREIELHQLADNILDKNGELSSQVMIIKDTVPKQHNCLSDEPLIDDDLPPPLPPKMIDFDEDMESPPQQGELETEETPPPLPPPYKETSLKKTFCSSAPPIPPKNNLQT